MDQQASEAAFLLDVHQRLLRRYDLDRWHWRRETPPFAVCAGAILVQHTSWANVEKALANLRLAETGSPEALHAIAEDDLADLIRPAGMPVTKARRLRTFASLVIERGGFGALFALPEGDLRSLLLATPGIGPETADVILLYGALRPVAVHDAYTARLLTRLGLGPRDQRYDVWRRWLDERLPPTNDFRRQNHAAIVIHSKETCRARPLCPRCALIDICAFGKNRGASGAE